MLIGRIDGFTRVLGKPEGWPEDKPCQALHIKDIAIDDGNVMVSAWCPTPQEAVAIAEGGHIHLWIWGTGHPPVAVTVSGVIHKGNAWYEKSCGALVCDVEIEDITQTLSDTSAQWYGAKYFVGESISESAAEKLAVRLGLKWCGRTIKER